MHRTKVLEADILVTDQDKLIQVAAEWLHLEVQELLL